MVIARNQTMLTESESGSASHNGHGSARNASTEQAGSPDKPCYWVNIWTRLNAMRNSLQLCDVELEAEDGSVFGAHLAVLAASSDVFHSHLMLKKSPSFKFRDGTSNRMLIHGVSGPALKVTLDFVYGIAPTNPEELSLLLEGGQVMGISGALAFCKRNSMLVRNEDSLHTSIAPASLVESRKPEGDELTTGCHEWKVTPGDTATPQSRADQAKDKTFGAKTPGSCHSDYVLDLSFNDLETMSKCPVLKELADEGMDCAADGILAESQNLLSGSQGQRDISRADDKKQDPGQGNLACKKLEPSRSDLSCVTPDLGQADPSVVTAAPVADDVATAVGSTNDDLDIKALVCPFAKTSTMSYDEDKTSRADVMSAAPHPGGHQDGSAAREPVLQCPFLKSLGEDQPQMKPSACSEGDGVKLLKSPLPSSEMTPTENSDELVNFSSDFSSPSDVLSTASWQNLNAEIVQAPSISHPMYSQCGGDGYFSGSPDGKLRAAGGCEQLPTILSDSQVNQSVMCQTVSVVGGQDQLSPTQSTTNVQLSLRSSMLDENPLVSFGSQFPLSTGTVFPEGFANNNSSNYDQIASSGEAIFNPHCAVKCQKGVASNSNSFLPENDAPIYSSPRPSSVVNIIYGNLSGAGQPPESSAPVIATQLASSSNDIPMSSVPGDASHVKNVVPEMPKSLIADEVNSVEKLIPSPNQRCPDPSNSQHQSTLKPDSLVTHGLASPCRTSVLWDASGCSTMDNATIKAKLKLNRGQEYICLVDSCSYSNKCLDYMQSHMYRKHGIGRPDVTCPLCNKAFFSVGQLKGHTKRAHKPETRQSDTETVQCEDCDEVFTNVQKLQTHRLKSHCKGRLFTCEECDFRSPRKKDVQAHMVSQHKKIPPGVQVFECVHCDYKCTDKNRAEEHQAMHTGQPKFVCKICGKSYTTRRGMRTHMQYHSTERPHRCDTCNAAFKVRSKLRDHVRLVHTHVGVKPYECGYCGHKTALRGNCNQHCRKHHPGLPVCVVDHQQGIRRNKRSYDYAGLKGEGIVECRDVRKHLRAVSP